MKFEQLIKFISLLAVIILVSCEYEKIEPIVVELPDEPISYSSEIQPVFDAKCLTCHSSNKPVLIAGQSYNNLISGSYIDTDEPDDSELYEKVSEGHPGGNNSLTAEELAKILKWIEEGAQNN